jgi:hypothetical protein
MTGEEKWDRFACVGLFFTNGIKIPPGHISGYTFTSQELDGIRWAIKEIARLRKIIKDIEESGVCR